MKLKTKKNMIESQRQAYEKMARQIGVVDFRRDIVSGQYLNWGTSMDFRIWMRSIPAMH